MAKYTLKTQQGNGKPSGQIMCIADSSRSTQNTTNNKDKQMQIASNADDLRTFRAKTVTAYSQRACWEGRVHCRQQQISTKCTRKTTKDEQMPITSNANELRTFRAKRVKQHVHSARGGRVMQWTAAADQHKMQYR